jgi:endonuclease YncB( thermonuclease family)
MAAWLIAAAETLTGRVVRIQDGDTLTVLIAHHQVRVRLADIDAPEPHQPFYAQSRQSLAALCFKNEAQLEVRGRDRNKRPVAYVACGGVDANAEQVRKGLAWVEPRFAPKGSRLYALHDEAKAAGRGLWADPHPIPPWEWRRKQREQVR